MICKNCGTRFSSKDADANGYVFCPECGKKYRRVPKAAQTETVDNKPVRRAEARKAKKSSGSPLTAKLGGKVPVWLAGVAALVLIAIVIVVIAVAGGGSGSARGLTDGVWLYWEELDEYFEDEAPSSVFKFNSNGSCIIYEISDDILYAIGEGEIDVPSPEGLIKYADEGEEERFSWKTEGDKLVITVEKDEDGTEALEGTLASSGNYIELKEYWYSDDGDVDIDDDIMVLVKYEPSGYKDRVLKTIPGTWKEKEYGGKVEFRSDGSWTAKLYGEEVPGTWKLVSADIFSGGRLELTYTYRGESETAEGVVRDTGHMYSYLFKQMTKTAEP